MAPYGLAGLERSGADGTTMSVAREAICSTSSSANAVSWPAKAIDIARDILGNEPGIARRTIRIRAPLATENARERVAQALEIWRETMPLRGTRGEHYFASRQLDVAGLSLDHVLRWHQRSNAVLALMTDALTSAPIGVHRTFLNADGSKRERRMLGRQALVRLSPDDEIASGLAIAEGIEDALAILLAGWTPVWAATSAGAIAKLPLLPGIETLTVFADADAAGLRAAHECSRHWQDGGREVVVASPAVLR